MFTLSTPVVFITGVDKVSCTSDLRGTTGFLSSESFVHIGGRKSDLWITQPGLGKSCFPKCWSASILVFFTCDGKMEQEINRVIGAVSVVETLHRSVVVKKELTRKSTTAPLHCDEPVKVLASGQDLPGLSPWRGFSGMPNQKETPRQTQNTLER